VNPVLLAFASGYTFVARGYALDTKYLSELIAQGIQHPGSALIDVLQTCPTYNDLHTKGWYSANVNNEPRLYRLDSTDYDPVVHHPDDPVELAQKKAQALLKSEEAGGRVALGVYFKAVTPTYEDFLKSRIPKLREKPLAELDLDHRDISRNLAKLK